MALIKYTCFDCKKEIEISSEFGRREECPNCGADVHSCKNCAFYDASSYNECRETSADVVREKERANHCDFFKLGNDTHKGESKDDLLAAAEALFKK